MKSKLISFILALCLLISIPLSALYKYNPFTRKLDYYEPVSGSDLGDLGDVTLTGLATGNVLYYNGTAWVNLATGANAEVLTLAAGIPSWAAGGAPAAHAASHEVGGADLVDHDQLTNYLAAQHLTLPNTIVAVLTNHNAAVHVALGFLALPSTIAAVLTDHNLLAHTALGLFDASADVDHDLTTNYLAAQHLTLPAGIAAVLTDHNLLAHTALGLFDASGDVDHNLTTNYAANQHVVLPNTIANVLSDHNLAAHTVLGLFDASADVDHNATTNYFIYNHVGEDHLVEHTLWIGWLAGQDLAVGGQYNTLVGEQAGTDVTTGDNNVMVGYQTGFIETTVANATFVGYQAGMNLSGTNDNTAVGYKAMWGIAPTGYGQNVAVGSEAFTNIGEESLRNTVVGVQALSTASDEAENITAIGYRAAANLVSPASNSVLIGSFAGLGGVGADYEYNVIIGVDSGSAITSGSWNTVVGNAAAGSLTTGAYNIIIGHDSGSRITTNSYNILIGRDIASVAASQAHSNVIIGDTAAIELTNGYENIIIGKEAARDIKSAGLNVIIGWQASLEHETGNYNTIVGTQAGYGVAGLSNYEYNTFIGMQAGYFAQTGAIRNVAVGYKAAEDLSTGDDNVAIGLSAGSAITIASSNVAIGKDAMLYNKTGASNTIIGMDAGKSILNQNFSQNVFIGYRTGYDARTNANYNTYIGAEAGGDNEFGSYNVFIGRQAGWNENGSNKLFIESSNAAIPLIYGEFDNDHIAINGDFNVIMDAALDQVLIQQSATAGTEDQPLIFIDDDRTGATANEVGEATIVIDAEGYAALYVIDGISAFGKSVYIYATSGIEIDNQSWTMGAGQDWGTMWDTNGVGDDLVTFRLVAGGPGTTAMWYSTTALNPSAMVDHEDYLSPTFVMVNDEGADANDYSGVVIGERAQANVKVAHYFDFFAMTGAADGSVVSADELPAIFRFGASGTATPTYATTGGDVLLEGQLEVDGDVQHGAYNRFDYIYWIECFDHGLAANRYGQMWDITSLNTQGAGTNTIDTTPSHITLTTDNNAIGDNEGTITHFQIALRARLNRSAFSVDLGQTANTQFYCGWNTSQTNAMVAAADEYVIVFFDVSDNANWQIKVGDGATEDVFTSAVAADTNHITHEIWVETDGTVHWVINDTEIDITGTVNNLMTANGHYIIIGQAQSVTGAAAIVAEICHIENEKLKL